MGFSHGCAAACSRGSRLTILYTLFVIALFASSSLFCSSSFCCLVDDRSFALSWTVAGGYLMATAQNKFLAVAAASHRCVDYDGSSKEKEEEDEENTRSV